jgi:TMPIT-like protein
LGTAYFVLPETWKIRYKTEYENFKLYMTIYSFLFSSLNLFFLDHASYWADLTYYFSLLYFYWTITLREHILLVNGSRIRPWWLLHHYLSIALVGTILIWPQGHALSAFRPLFYAFCIYVSALQYLQYRYQMNRLYTLRALSKIGPMDVTTDSAQVHVRNNLTFLLPFLIFGQFFQFYNAYFLIAYYFQHTAPDPTCAPDGLVPEHWHLSCLCLFSTDSPPWQVLVSALLYFFLAVGNLSTTLLTFYQKVRKTLPPPTSDKSA